MTGASVADDGSMSVRSRRSCELMGETLPYAGLSSNRGGLYDLCLPSCHDPRFCSGLVVEAAQVKEAVHEVKLDFVFNRGVKMPSIPLRGFDADKNFAVLKSDHVGRPRNLHELTMQRGNATIGDEQNIYLRQARERTARRTFQTKMKCAFGEFLERENVETKTALRVSHLDCREFSHETSGTKLRSWSSAFNSAWSALNRGIAAPAASARRSGSPQMASTSRGRPFSKSTSVEGLYAPNE